MQRFPSRHSVWKIRSGFKGRAGVRSWPGLTAGGSRRTGDPSPCRRTAGGWECWGGWLPASTITGIRPARSVVSGRCSGSGSSGSEWDYGDLNDRDRIRRESVLALACGRDDLTGQKHARVRDRGCPLAGSRTLNRLELGRSGSAESHRYRKTVANPEKLEALLVHRFLDMHSGPPEEIVRDIDATDDQVMASSRGLSFTATTVTIAFGLSTSRVATICPAYGVARRGSTPRRALSKPLRLLPEAVPFAPLGTCARVRHAGLRSLLKGERGV